MMKTIRLKERSCRTQDPSKLPFPKRDPRFDRNGLIDWRTEEMDVIGHDHVRADHPAIGLIPCLQQCVMNHGIRQIPLARPRTDCRKNDRRLTAKDEDAFGRMAAHS
jgi:hypothetical protein